METMRDKCKCHGVSGSCTLKTCWRKMGDFNTTAAVLRAKYHQAVRKQPSNKASRRSAPKEPKTPKVKTLKGKRNVNNFHFIFELLQLSLYLFVYSLLIEISLYDAIISGNITNILFCHQGATMSSSRQLCDTLLYAWTCYTIGESHGKVSLSFS